MQVITFAQRDHAEASLEAPLAAVLRARSFGKESFLVQTIFSLHLFLVFLQNPFFIFFKTTSKALDAMFAELRVPLRNCRLIEQAEATPGCTQPDMQPSQPQRQPHSRSNF